MALGQHSPQPDPPPLGTTQPAVLHTHLFPNGELGGGELREQKNTLPAVKNTFPRDFRRLSEAKGYITLAHQTDSP